MGWCSIAMGLILSGSIVIVGLVMANVIVSWKYASTAHIMYIIAISFVWDFFLLQVIYVLIQAASIKHLKSNHQRIEDLKGITGLIVNYDIALA